VSTAATVSVLPYNLTFGNEAVETTGSPQTVTVRNNGSTALTITGITFAGAKAGDFIQNNTCGTSVAAGASCTIVVLFRPTASGSVTAWLEIIDNAGISPQVVNLSGAGTHDVILSWSAGSSTGTIGYDIFRGTAPGGEGATPLNPTPVNGASYVDESVSAGVTYYYVLTSVAADGVTQSGRSNEASAAVPSP
jgi:Abnormal spindle-like microcephaly-assoc'd, ASPM-SPD-2-Hydin